MLMDHFTGSSAATEPGTWAWSRPAKAASRIVNHVLIMD
jgi:hypothetical protein